MSKIEYWIRKNIDKKHLRQWSLSFTAFILIAVVPLFIYKVFQLIGTYIRDKRQHYRAFVKETEEWGKA
jgi:hypothetical protein